MYATAMKQQLREHIAILQCFNVKSIHDATNGIAE